MTEQEGLMIEECKKCVENPNICNKSVIYQKVRHLSQVLAKLGVHHDTRGMTCYEIRDLLDAELNKLKIMNRYTVFTTGQGFEVRATNINDAWQKAQCSQIVSYNDLKITNVMLHFSVMENHIDHTLAIEIKHTDQFGNHTRTICPTCEAHNQGDCSEVHDCKTVFMKDGKSYGQCCCYSREHGLRSDI